jgi:hypothetical protein
VFLHTEASDRQSEVITMTAPQSLSIPQQMVELAEAQWLGLWSGQVLFRDPVTCSSCSLPEATLTVAGIRKKLESKRAEFGLV